MTVSTESNGRSGTGGLTEGVVAVEQVSDVGLARLRKKYTTTSNQAKNTLRIASLNVGTMKGRSSEVVETMERRGVDVCCLQETRWRGASARKISGKAATYKFLWSGNAKGTGGVGVLIAERWIDNVFEVNRVSDRIMLVKMNVGEVVFAVISVYAPQVGLDDSVKDAFYDDLLSLTLSIPSSNILAICGDFNGHIGELSAGYEGVHGGYGLGARNTEGERILEFSVAHNLVVTNSHFRKKPSHIVTYKSGTSISQIDYILVRKRDRKLIRDVKVIPGEECAPQHRLLVGDFMVALPQIIRKKFVPRCRTWKLREDEQKGHFQQLFAASSNNLARPLPDDPPDSIWGNFKACLLSAADEVCGHTKKHTWRKETWWWSAEIDALVKAKRKAWKEWKSGGSREEYNRMKREAKRAVYHAKKAAEEEKFACLEDKPAEMFRLAKQMKRENQDVVGEKCVLNDDGEMAFSDDSKKGAWHQHYERLLNVEFPWDKENLPPFDPVQGPAVYITKEMVVGAVKKLKNGKAPGPSGVVGEMLKASGDAGIDMLHHLVNAIIRDGSVPVDWQESYIISLYKGKGSALERGNYRGLKLLEHAMKVVERIIETIIRQMVDIDEMQFGFMPGKGTTDAIFILRQVQEKFLSKDKLLYFAFVDLEKAFDRVPREILWWSLRKVGVEEWVVRVVQAMYHDARSRVRVNDSYSNSLDVKVGVHQGSVLSPLLFVIVLEAISREFRVGCPWELLYADDLVAMSESLEDLKDSLATWKEKLESKGLRVNMGKTKIMISGPELNTLKDSGKFPCGVCRKGVGVNSIFCQGCQHWTHKKCSGISGRLIDDPDFRCKRCQGIARPIDARPCTEVHIGGEPVEVVDGFCYLGDALSAGGGCERAIIARTRSAWGKFKELLPLLTSRSISLNRRGKLYESCVRRVMLYGCQCWAPTQKDLDRLVRTDRTMIRWMANVRLEQHISSDSLLSRFGITPINEIARRDRLRWYGHVCRSDDCIGRVTSLDVGGRPRRGRPRKTWSEVISNDRRNWGMLDADPLDRYEWRKRTRDCYENRRTRQSVEQ